MKSKIDYGIDLGTTNSAIARMENGIPVIKKSDTLKDTVPSCVHFNKRKDVLVGDSAVGAMKNDNTRALRTFQRNAMNTFIEFKRTMGTAHTYESLHLEKSLTSEELSAEVLKKLKSLIQDEPVSSIVVTVPAKFLNPQNEATMRAAKMAGFQHVELLQEPVAAATAYGLSAAKKDAFWLVFDFGGGTFDTALIRSEEGILRVKDTHGDNWLGGKNLDEAIVDQLLIPNLREHFEMDGILNDATKQQLLREVLKPMAEQIKIEMSFKDHCSFVSNLGDLPFLDDAGLEPEVDLTVTQTDMEKVLSPIFQKSIDITLDLMRRNNLTRTAIDAVILVGGPTYSPILRRMLKEQVSERIDTTVDPMTVVARGAALFASTVSVSEEVKDSTRDRAKIQLDIKYEAATVELDTMINIRILQEKTNSDIPDTLYAVISRSDGSWSSCKKQLNTGKGTLIDDIQLVNACANAFRIHLYDAAENALECQPDQFTIIQGIGGLEGMQVLPYHIGIGKYFYAEDKDLFLPVKGLEMNKKVPATGVINGLKTRQIIRPGMKTDVIRIPIYQGAYQAEGTSLLFHDLINEVIISGETMPAVLPAGSDVDITIKIDRSQIMNFSAYFPLLNHTEELNIEIRQKVPPREEELKEQITLTRQLAEKYGEHTVIERMDILEQQLLNERGSADGKMKILDEIRKERFILDAVEKSAEWPQLKEELEQAFYSLEELVKLIKANSDEEKVDLPKIESHVQEYRGRVERIIKEKNAKEANTCKMEMATMDLSIRNFLSENAIVIEELRTLQSNFESIKWKDPNKARQLIKRSLQLASEGKTDNLQGLINDIFDLMPYGDRETLR